MAKLLRTVLLKRVPKSGMPSTRTLAIGVTTPVWISAAAAFVTAGVTRLVAPVWSSGPNGDAFTSALQSAWASAPPHPPKNASKLSTAAAERALSLMGSSLGSAQVTSKFLVSLDDGSVYPKFQQSTHAISPPMRVGGECGGLAGNVTAQKKRHTRPAFDSSAERKIG